MPQQSPDPNDYKGMHDESLQRLNMQIETFQRAADVAQKQGDGERRTWHVKAH